MFGWIKKRIFKSIVKDIIKEMPEYKEEALKLLEIHKDELLKKLQEVIKDFIKERVKDYFNKEG